MKFSILENLQKMHFFQDKNFSNSWQSKPGNFFNGCVLKKFERSWRILSIVVKFELLGIPANSPRRARDYSGLGRVGGLGTCLGKSAKILDISNLTNIESTLPWWLTYFTPRYCESHLLDRFPGVGEFAWAKRFLGQVEVRGGVK